MNQAYPKLPNGHPMSQVEHQMCHLLCHHSFNVLTCVLVVFTTHTDNTPLSFCQLLLILVCITKKRDNSSAVLFCYDLFSCFCLHKVMFAFVQPEPGLSHRGLVNAVLICVCTSSWIRVVRCRQILCTVYRFFMSVSGYLFTVFSMCLHVWSCTSILLVSVFNGQWCLDQWCLMPEDLHTQTIKHLQHISRRT